LNSGSGKPPIPSYRVAKSRLGEVELLVRLAVPVTVAQVGMLGMGLVDTWMVGQLGPTELAAVALGDACFFTLLVVAMGLVSAVEPLISQAHGARDPVACASAWRAGLRVAIALTLPLAALVFALEPLLAQAGLDERLVAIVGEYLAARSLGIAPWLFYRVDRGLLNSLGRTRPAMVVVLAANLVNVVFDWMFIFGNWGAPALGVAGSGLTTTISSWFLFLALHYWVRRVPDYAVYVTGSAAIPPGLIGKLVRLGLPIGLGHGVEVGAFAACSIFMGWLGVVQLASHQIALKMASTSFMVAVALGVAASIRVGNGIGAGRPQDAQRSAWMAFLIGLACMSLTGAAFLLGGETIAGSFSDDPGVIEVGGALLAIAAAFQLSDGTQAICAGALRGAGDTVRPLLAQLFAHWGIGIPLGYVLAFRLDFGPEGVWWALALGLTVAAGILLIRLRSIRGSSRI